MTFDFTYRGLVCQIRSTLISIKNALFFGNTPSKYSVSQSASSVLLIAENLNRKEVIIRNDAQGKQILYVAYESPATTAEAIRLEKNDILIEDRYTGAVYGIWDAAGSGFARITEVEK